MDFEELKNETLTRLKTCKREEEADTVLVATHQKMMDDNIDTEEQFQFWKEMHDRLGERKVSALEEETKHSTDPIIELSRARIEEIMRKENRER